MLSRRRGRCTLACLVVALATSSPALAQFPATLTVGSRVRLEVADTVRQIPIGPQIQRITGTVAAYAADTLRIDVPNTEGTLAIPRSSVRRVYVSRGVPSRTQSALTSGVVTMLLGASVFLWSRQWDDDGPFNSERDAVLAGAGVGLVLGVAVGAAWPVERWRRVRLDR